MARCHAVTAATSRRDKAGRFVAATPPDPQKNGSKPPKKGSPPAKKGASPAEKRRNRAAETPGAALKRQLSTERDTVGITVLIRQAARVADRLENIDRVLSGDGDAWIRVGIPRSDEKRGRVLVEARVDDLVREERSQTTVLRSLLAEIHRQRSGLTGGPPGPDEDDDLDVE